eukprot:1087781-Karenia_brevis.AAC.1
MAKSVRASKKEVKRVVTVAVAHISFFNNIIIRIADRQGNALSWATSGGSGFRSSRRSSPFAARAAAERAADMVLEYGFKM